MLAAGSPNSTIASSLLIGTDLSAVRTEDVRERAVGTISVLEVGKMAQYPSDKRPYAWRPISRMRTTDSSYQEIFRSAVSRPPKQGRLPQTCRAVALFREVWQDSLSPINGRHADTAAKNAYFPTLPTLFSHTPWPNGLSQPHTATTCSCQARHIPGRRLDYPFEQPTCRRGARDSSQTCHADANSNFPARSVHLGR